MKQIVSFLPGHLNLRSRLPESSRAEDGGPGGGVNFVGVLRRLGWTGLELSVAQWAGACCVSQILWLDFFLFLREPASWHTGKEKEGGGQVREDIN